MMILNKIEIIVHGVIFGLFLILSVQLLIEDALGREHLYRQIQKEYKISYIEASSENPYVPPVLSNDLAEMYGIHREYKNKSTGWFSNM